MMSRINQGVVIEPIKGGVKKEGRRTKRERVCVYVCVWEREKEREMFKVSRNENDSVIAKRSPLGDRHVQPPPRAHRPAPGPAAARGLPE